MTAFPVGYHRPHPDVSLNFQMNRFFNWVGEPRMLEEMREVAPRIAGYADFTRELLALSEHAPTNGQRLAAAFHLRAAEFFMFSHDPAKQSARERFLKAVREHYGVRETDRLTIAYEGGGLSAYRVFPPAPTGTVVMFGRFDSYIEECFAVMFALRDAGYDVIAFDGPGQGTPLEDFGLTMTGEWDKPVKAVLDHFGVDDVSLLGFSLGGGLAMRAAAGEPRVRRVIACDVLSDLSDVVLRPLTPTARLTLKALCNPGAGRAVNRLVRSAARRKLLVQWGSSRGCMSRGAVLRTSSCERSSCCEPMMSRRA